MLKIFPRPTGEIQGDDKPIPNSDAAFSGEFDKSLPDFDRGDLKRGYTPMGSIKSTSKSDEPDWA